MRRHRLSVRRPMFVLGLLIASALVVGGIAYASIPDSEGTIHGCFSPNAARNTNGSELRIIDSDSASCSKGQQAVTWNGKSPDSFAAAGQSCEAGRVVTGIGSTGSLLCSTPPPPRLYEAVLPLQQEVNSHFIPVGSLAIPVAGTYFVTAKVTVQNVFHDGRWQCRLHRGDLAEFDESELFTTGGSLIVSDNFNGTIPLQGRIQVAAGDLIKLNCVTSSDEGNQVVHGKIAALQVTAG